MHTHQLFYIPLFSRAVSHRILPGKSLNWLKSALLKLRVVVLLYALLLPLRILNCIISWSVQPSLPPTFTNKAELVVDASIRSSRAPLLVGSLIICVRKSSSTHSRNVLQPYCIVLPKDTVVKVSQEPGPVNARLLPVVRRQPPLHLPDQVISFPFV